MLLSYYNILSIVILFQLGMLVVFLLTVKRGRKISNRLLAFFFVLLMINLLDGVLTYYGLYKRFPAFAHLEDGFVFLLGPVIYFYTVSLLFHEFRLSVRDLLHAVPFVLITVGFQFFYHLQSEQYQKMIQEAIVSQTLPPAFYATAVAIYAHIGIYIWFSFLELKRYRIRIREKFSSVGKINLDWLSYMLWFMALILILSLLYTLMPAIGLKEYFRFVFALVFLMMFVFINGIVWKGLRQPEIFAGLETEVPSAKRNRDPLSDAENDRIRQALQAAITEKKVFLDPELTLDGLASSLGFPPRKVSQVLNDQFNQNFFDFVNTCRITEAERILKESPDPKLTVLEVMYACGFNSKSSFNTIFKEKTGYTPSAYRKTFCVK